MQGHLFTQDFLRFGILETPAWQALDDTRLAAFRARLETIFAGLHADSTLNEAQTEGVLIEPILRELGWSGPGGDHWLSQVNLSGKRREDVPDCLLFPDAAASALALAEPSDDRRVRHGLALLEAKRWLRPLDRGDEGEPLDPGAPSSQMLRYLSRAELLSERRVKWGILTNGGVWRLYWQDARSRAEEFLELDLAALLALPGVAPEPEGFEPDQGLRLFYLLFHRDAFLPQPWDAEGRTLHGYALREARLYEERVSQDLGARVFNEVFPALAEALAAGDLEAKTRTIGLGTFARPIYTDAYLAELREATLVLLYRLLFLFYAEDRALLPVRDPRYHDYSLRRIREQVRDKTESGGAFASRLANIWLMLQSVFSLLDEGEDIIGMPAYNGGLFDRARSPLLARTRVPDARLAPVIDALSRRAGPNQPNAGQRAWINYRDLSVAHLGGIYERLLEYVLEMRPGMAVGRGGVPVVAPGSRNAELAAQGTGLLRARPASFARKVSGSYYTHDELVRLILLESVGRLIAERHAAFDDQIKRWRKKESLNPAEWERLDAKDPASAILRLKICDPAMGSGHFLVSLVDYLADQALEAINRAAQAVAAQPWAAHLAERGRPWESPVTARIAHIRRTLKNTAREHGWNVSDKQLDDRHIVRRMILKKSIFGVDKNPMAVELAKTALWLHTFTVGAPLSFLDHHLRCGDSLHGERLDALRDGLHRIGILFQTAELARLELAGRNLREVADLTDVDIAEVHLSKRLAAEAERQIAPLHALLDLWRALRWLAPGWPPEPGKPAKLDDAALRAALAELLSGRHNLVAVAHAGRLLAEGEEVPEPPVVPPEVVDPDDEPGSAELRSANGLASGTMPEMRPRAEHSSALPTLPALPAPLFNGATRDIQAANWLLARVRALAAEETFFHWWSAFPDVWRDGKGGFDAVIGNPPWDRIKLQEVEWFAERRPEIANQPRAADRKLAIAELERRKDPLWKEYLAAQGRAETNARVLRQCGDFPLLSGGDVNLYSLFVERALSLIRPDGIVGLLTPSGIAADKGAAPFFGGITRAGRLGTLFDFENKKGFFPDVDSRFKFSAFVFGGPGRTFPESRCAFYLHGMGDLADPERLLNLNAEDFRRVNPNTGAAPVFRTRRDAAITTAIYGRSPVLVDRSGETEKRVWPVRYLTQFHMTNDSGLFLTRAELEKQGWKPAALNRWQRTGADGEPETAAPLYVGKMMYLYDHRASDVTVNEGNLHNAAVSSGMTDKRKVDPSSYPEPQYWVREHEIPKGEIRPWVLGFRDIARATDMRTMIAAILPTPCCGNTLPLIQPIDPHDPGHWRILLLANLGSLAMDYIARQKVQTTHLNWYIVEQLPVIPPERFDEPLAGRPIADWVRDEVLALSYTAHDLAPLARDLGHLDADGAPLPPFPWDPEQRRQRMARLDALFFHLYGIDRDDAAYILETFPILREKEQRAFGDYRLQRMILQDMERIEAGEWPG